MAAARGAANDITGRTCPYCRFAITPGTDISACSGCQAVYHADCWNDNGGCAVMGCAMAPQMAVAPHMAMAGKGASSTTSSETSDYAPRPLPTVPVPPEAIRIGAPRRPLRPMVASAAAIGALLVAAAGVAVAIFVIHSGGTAKRVSTAALVTTARPQTTGATHAPTASTQVSTMLVTSTVVVPATTTAASTTASATSTESTTPAPPQLVTFSGQDFQVGIPSDWQQIPDRSQPPSFLDARWALPGNSHVIVIADESPHCGDSCNGPGEGGAPVREAKAHEPGYNEITWAPATFPGGHARLFQYVANGSEVVDAFFTACSNGYAIAGKAPVDVYPQYDALFRSMIASFEPSTC